MVLKSCHQLTALELVREEVHQLFKVQLKYLNRRVESGQTDKVMHHNMSSLFYADIERYKSCLRQASKLVSVFKLISSNSILEFLKIAGLNVLSFPTDAVFHCMAGGLKLPGGYMRIPAHQDWPAIQSSLDSVVVWSTLMDIQSQLFFPLEVIPGSHLGGLLKGNSTDHFYEISTGEFDADSFVPLFVDKCDVIIFSSFLVHQTGLGNDDKLRLAFSTRYENVIEPTNIERSFPNIHRRVVDRDLAKTQPPNLKDVSMIFGE